MQAHSNHARLREAGASNEQRPGRTSDLVVHKWAILGSNQ